MRSNELKCFIEQLDQLPTLPAVAIRLLNRVNEEGSTAEEISGLTGLDPALSSKLLRIANSEHFGVNRQVTTLPMAVSLLGVELVRSIALSIMVFDSFNPKDAPSVQLQGFWRHSISCAIGSELLAERFGYPQPQEAFVAGLLHDIGKLVFFLWNLDEYNKVVDEADSTRTLLLETEEKQLGIGHTQAGKLLLDRWNFPPALVNVAWLHHQPDSQFGPDPRRELPFIVKCANNLSHLYGWGESGNPRPDLDRLQLQKLTGFSAQALASVSEIVPQRFDEVWKNLDWENSTLNSYLSALSGANQELAQLQVELTLRSRQLEHQQAIVRAIFLLQESLPARTTCGRALSQILEPLGKTTGASRMMSFIFLEQQGVIEGCLKLATDTPPQWITLPLTLNPNEQASRLKSRRQYALIENAVLENQFDPDLTGKLRECLGSGDLLVLPLLSTSGLLGQIFLEMTGSEWHRPQSVDLLRQYAREAASALERVLLVETLDQQAEDLAQLVRREQEAQVRLSQTQQLASVGRLAAGAAHEINNPLAAMSLQAELLLKKAKTEDERKALEMMLEQSSRISKIIGDLMGFARPAPLKVQATDVIKILDRTLNVLANRINLSGIEVCQDHRVTDPLVSADPRQLEQVFLNLIINAVQAMPMGGTLTLATHRHPNNLIRIDVGDTGVGIESEHLHSIFDPFYTTKASGEGAGLGLSICYSILKNHGGQIHLHSEPGNGTTFSVLLPPGKRPDGHRTPAPPAMHPESSSAKAQSPPRSVLIIEDEAPVALLLEEFLSNKGYQVITAADGVEGLELMGTESPDVVIIDLRLPRKDGLEVVKTARKNGWEQPLIVISGIADDQMFKSAQQAGANVCIRKPFLVTDILEAVQGAPQTRSGDQDKVEKYGSDGTGFRLVSRNSA